MKLLEEESGIPRHDGRSLGTAKLPERCAKILFLMGDLEEAIMGLDLKLPRPERESQGRGGRRSSLGRDSPGAVAPPHDPRMVQAYLPEGSATFAKKFCRRGIEVDGHLVPHEQIEHSGHDLVMYIPGVTAEYRRCPSRCRRERDHLVPIVYLENLPTPTGEYEQHSGGKNIVDGQGP